MKIRLTHKDITVFLGNITIVDDAISCSEFPFIEKIIGTTYLKMFAFTILEDLLMTLLEVKHNSEITYLFIKVQKYHIINNEFEYIIDPNAKLLFDTYIEELKQYSLETGGKVDYAEMFKIKKGTKC
jgi:hypothetical protein